MQWVWHIMRSEAEADAADDAALPMIDSDVIKKLMLKDGKRYRDTSLGSLLGQSICLIEADLLEMHVISVIWSR
jgi:hypothetical protein